MTIKNRLEKLEKTSNLDSDFCTCPREFEIKFIEPDVDKVDADSESERAEQPKPVYCEKCDKVIERKVIEIKFVECEIQRTDTKVL